MAVPRYATLRVVKTSKPTYEIRVGCGKVAIRCTETVTWQDRAKVAIYCIHEDVYEVSTQLLPEVMTLNDL